MRLPCIIKFPGIKSKGIVNNAMINWTDLAPTILDMVGVDNTKFGFHGRSFKNILDQTNPVGWDEIYASHTFHEITMYYPMRVCQERQYKLIWNIAWRLEYPFSTDLWASSTWQSVYRNKIDYFGKRKVSDYLFRPEFELYDMIKDPSEIHNLAGDKTYLVILESLKQKIKTFQKNTSDPWYIMWNHETFIKMNGVNL
jgi:N-sulfoglucosamine sulfohydrolase